MRIDQVQAHTPFTLTDSWAYDLPLQECLARQLDQSEIGRQNWPAVKESLARFSKKSASEARRFSELCERPGSHPRLVQFDEWGRRVDRVETSEGWRSLLDWQVRNRIIGEAYPMQYQRDLQETHSRSLGGRTGLGETARLFSFARTFIFSPDSQVSLCPTSMTDACARVLELYGTHTQKDRYLPRLLSARPEHAWYSGQWMTELRGGSDVSMSETVAHKVSLAGQPASKGKAGDVYTVSGFKWFSSAIDGNMSLALARTDADLTKGSRGLSLFLIPLHKKDRPILPEGTNFKDKTPPTSPYNGIKVHRLKHKLGTQLVPTAEIEIDGALAELVGEEGRGVSQIAQMLNITRIYSANGSISSVGRALHILQSYSSQRRVGVRGSAVFLKDITMHNALLARVAVNYRALLQLQWNITRLMGKSESGASTEREERRLRLFTPVAKAFAATRATDCLVQAIECMGGQGFMQENPLTTLFRDATVERIWEGPPSILSLDVARVHAQTRGRAVEEWIEDTLISIGTAEKSLGALSKDTLPKIIGTLRTCLHELRSVFVDRKQLLKPDDDQRLARSLLDLLAIIEAGSQLLQQACWSATTTVQPHGDAAFELEVTARWVCGTEGSLVPTQANMRSLLEGGQSSTFEHDLVHGKAKL